MARQYLRAGRKVIATVRAQQALDGERIRDLKFVLELCVEHLVTNSPKYRREGIIQAARSRLKEAWRCEVCSDIYGREGHACAWTGKKPARER